MNTVTSQDGTRIAYDQRGTGQLLILVAGAFGHRHFAGMSDLAALLMPDFTVIAYDRRGRGDSGDTQPYAVAREIEDLEALIDAVGGSAFVYGASSGAILALEATQRFPQKVRKLALYEPPFIVNDVRPPLPEDFVQQMQTAIAEDRRGDAIDILMTHALQLPPEALPPLRKDPNWGEMLKVAHTLVYDAMIQSRYMMGEPLPRDRWSAVTCPTLVMNGETNDLLFQDGAEALAAILPHAQHRILAGQGHGVDAAALAPVLREFFLALTPGPSPTA